MSSFNKIIFLGNLTRDPALKYLSNQTPVCEWGMAANRKFNVNGEQREEVCFVDCAAFGKIAEVINEHCKKGKPILIEGRLKFDSWDDKNGGGKRSKLSIVVETFQFIGGRDDGGGERQPSRAPASSGARSNLKPSDAFGDDQEFAPDDIPF